MTPIVHQYPHESWSDAWHRRAAENLARMDHAITRLGQLNERDRELGTQMVQAITDLNAEIRVAAHKL